MRMEHFETSQHVVSHLPNKVLVELVILADFFLDETLEIPTICVLHNDTEHAVFFFKEGAFVLNDVRGIDGCQQTNFIEGIIFFFGTEFVQFDLLDGIFFLSALALFHDFQDSAETSTSEFFDDLKLVHFLFIEETYQ